MKKSQNILLLIIDSMSYGDLEFIKKNLKYFPGFKTLLSKGYQYDRVYSNASPTEAVMPSLFTSSLPLDFQTYEYGIKKREKDIFLNLIRNDYTSYLINNTAMLDKLYGYNKNIINIIPQYSIEGTWRHFQKNYVWHCLNNNVYKRDLDKIKKFKEIVNRFFSFFKYYIKKDKSFFSLKINNLNNEKIERIIESIDAELLQIKKIKNDIDLFEKYAKKIMKNSFFKYFNEQTFKDKILTFLENLFKKKLFGWKDSTLNFFNYEIKFKNIVSNANIVFNKALNILTRNENKKKFVVVHLMDLHHLTIGSNNIFNKFSYKSNFKKLTKFDLPRTKSLKYIDNELLIFLNKIPKRTLNNTTIAVCSDHGSVEFEKTGPLTTRVLEGVFNDVFSRIPYVIYNPGFRGICKPDIIISSVNILPILLKVCKLNLNKKLSKLAKVGNQKFVISEHTHRGPSFNNLKSGILYIGVISKKYKYILKNNISSFDNSPEAKEIFIENKKKVVKNFASRKNKPKEFFLLKKIAKNRQNLLLGKMNIVR